MFILLQLKVLIIVLMFLILANITQFICLKILCLIIVFLYKMHFKQINIKNKVHNYYDNLTKAEKFETKNILIDEKNYKNLIIYLARYDHKKSTKMLSLYYHF